MALPRSITSADSNFVVYLPEIAFPAVFMEGYAVDSSFSFDSVQTSEVQLGVDGITSAGWVPRNYPMNIQFAADSESLKVWDALVAYQDAVRNVVRFGGVITLPGNKMSYTLERGVITNYTPIPEGAKVLQPRTLQIVWQRIIPVPVA